MKILIWIARLVAAVIMAQTLYFKFTGAAESVEIFTRVGMEPWGRIAVGIMELIASVLILVPAISWLGALVALGLMAGAIGMHLTILGIEVRGDGGQLFYYAVAVAVCAGFVLWRSRQQMVNALKRFG
jgi:putative oxidoreductase